MKIAELEAHHNAYVESEQTIRRMVYNHEFPAVFAVCIDVFPHLVPTINYWRKRDISPGRLDLLPIATICKYAPPLFEHSAIESLAKFVKSARVLASSERGYLSLIETARNREQLAHAIWNHLERQPGARQRDIRTELGVIQEYAVEIVELWEDLGVIEREPDDGTYRLFFRTQLDKEMDGVCQNCGVRGKGRKEAFLKPGACLKCGTLGYYHIEYRHPR
jgi:hypothetical protein